jgi:hypothetical protein
MHVLWCNFASSQYNVHKHAHTETDTCTDTQGSAGRVSELMPFLEFDLHKQILCKLKLRAHNAVWGLKMQLSINEEASHCPYARVLHSHMRSHQVACACCAYSQPCHTLNGPCMLSESVSQDAVNACRPNSQRP